MNVKQVSRCSFLISVLLLCGQTTTASTSSGPNEMVVAFKQATPPEDVIAAVTRRDVKLVLMSCVLPDFSAAYVLREGETPAEALASFQSDLKQIRRDVASHGVATDRGAIDIRLTSITITGADEEIQAVGGAFDALVSISTSAPDAFRRPPEVRSVATDSAGAFAPSVGSFSYDASTKELTSYFSWNDTGWTTSAGEVAYEHDLVVDGGLDDFVKWGSGTYASNLPNWYPDDTFDDKTTTLTIGSYPATVLAGITYFVRIPIQVVNPSLGPRDLSAKPQIGSWANTPLEWTYCTLRGFETASCIFSDETVTDLRFYRDRNASTPLFSRVLFDTSASWTYNWDRTFTFDTKTCPASMYRGEYINDVALDGLLRYVRCDSAVNFDWGASSPGLGIRNDQFGIRWTRRSDFTAGTYSFFVKSDDGVRVWIDDALRLDKWFEAGTAGSTFNQFLPDGYHTIKTEYYENGGDAHVLLQVQQPQSCYPVSAFANPTTGGTVNVNTTQNCSGGYTNGIAVGISALASSDYQFAGWTAANCTLANAAAAATTCTVTGTGSASVSAQFTTTASGSKELLTNGSFASGSTGWVRSGNFFADSRFSVCHSCPGYAYLANSDGTAGNNLTGTIYQAVTIPSNATSVTLTFWYSITTQEITTTTAYDVLFVSIQDITTGSAAGIAELSNLDSTSGYVKRTANLIGYAGHTVWLHFSSLTDGGKPTVFRVDDASIQVTTAASCTSFTISPSSRNPSASAGSKTVTITGLPAGCQGGAWNAAGNGSWLTVSPTSGTGSDSTVVSWSQNTSTSPRSANAMIAGNVFSVTQDGTSSTCTSFTLNPSSWSPTSSAGSQNVTLIGAPNGCQGGNWSASGNGSWLTVAPTSGTGPDSVTVSWSQNPNTSTRSDNATIAGNNFLVTQGGAPSVTIGSYTFTHLAGSDVGAGYFDGTGSTARFSYPYGVAIDSGGNVYLADTRNSTIRKITLAGIVTTVAGLAGSRGSADGTGGTARFAWPTSVATDGGGNVYVADSSNHTIRKITPAGVVTTLAGEAGSSGSTDGIGSAARFRSPRGVATDGAGNVYVADTANHLIRKITPTGMVTTLAGLASSSGSTDGTGSTARFYQPPGVTTDSGGNVYVADEMNHTIRKITSAGVVTTLAGLAGSAGYADGAGSAARFWFPGGVTTDSAGNVYVADGLHTIRKITPGGVVTTLAGQVATSGSADGTGSAAQFFYPRGVATDTAGNIYVADSYNNTLRKTTPTGVVTTLAGLSEDKSGSSNGTGSAARFNNPFGVATDNAGNVYVADSSNYTIRKISPSGVVSTFAGLAGAQGSADGTGSAARFRYTYGVATDNGGNVYVADSANNTIRKITPTGVVTTLAGLANSDGSTDGTGSAARFNYPYGVATDNGGSVYVADSFNNTVRKITPAGVVTTVAGLAGSSGSTDGTGSAARFNSPLGIATDGSGNVYVADSINYTVRKITPAGVVTTLAGLAGSSGNTDGAGSAARFNYPTGVETDSVGNVYVADSKNNTIRKVTPAGVVTTLAGIALSWGSTDGIGGGARFDEPSGLAIDNGGNLYVGDQNNHAIRVGREAIPDAAQIDSAGGTVGSTRQLYVAPQTATSWQWSVIRRPSGSTAQLSSMTLRNPNFTPDVADLYQFQLIATNSSGMSITLVSLLASAVAPAVPTGVTASAITSTRVDVSWIVVAGATYQIDRQRAGGGGFSQIGTPATNSFSDTTVSADSAYLYRVRAVNSSGQSTSSVADLATTVMFVDSPLTQGTAVKAVHLSQLRTAVNAVRLLAGLPTANFSDAATAGALIKAVHVTELRAALDAALGAIGLSTSRYTDPSLSGVTIKAVYFQELRNRVN